MVSGNSCASMRFEADIEAIGEGGSWAGLRVPFDVAMAFGSKGRVPVTGTLNGFPIRSSLFPTGDGSHQLMVNKEIQKRAGAGVGKRVAVELWLDDQPRKVVVPLELEQALRRQGLEKAFLELSYSRQKQMADLISGAKRAITRQARVAKVIEELSKG